MQKVNPSTRLIFSGIPCLLLACSSVCFAQFNPFPTQPFTPGGAGTPGTLDKNFRPLGASFIGNPDIRCAAVQTDGKIIIGGTFQIRASGINYSDDPAAPISVTVTYRNTARLNADGTLDPTYISLSAVQLARQEASTTDGTATITWGPDGAVYSIMTINNDGDDILQYVLTGDFLNFSHNAIGNPAPRRRYLVLAGLTPDPATSTTQVQPLLELTTNVADGDGFNSPVRKFKRIIGTQATIDITVSNTDARLNLRVPIGYVVLQLSNGFVYEKISGADNEPTSPEDWVVLPGGRRILWFAAGDFTSFANSVTERYITRGILAGEGLTLPPATDWEATPAPDRRVWDFDILGGQIFFVGDFETVSGGTVNWRKIAVINEGGFLDTSFNPGSGFNGNALGIVADPVGNSMVVVGEFTDYDGNPVGHVARIAPDGSMVAGFPAPNNGNSEGANGPVRTISRQPDGRLLIAGDFTTFNGIWRSGMARLESDGSLDLTFVPAGNASGIAAFAADADGGPGTASLFARPIAVGNFTRLFGSQLTGIARFVGGSYPVVWFQPNKIRPPHVVTLGDSLQLNVVATDNFVGYPGFEEPPFTPPQPPSEPLLYQWQQNGRDIQGAVNASYTISNAKPADASSYRVRIYNSQFSIFSEPVNVTTVNPFQAVLPRTGSKVFGIIAPDPFLNGNLGGTINLTINRLGWVTGVITLGNPDGIPVRHRFSAQYNFQDGMLIQIPRRNQSPIWLRIQTDLEGQINSFDFTSAENYLSDGQGQEAEIFAWNNQWTRNNPANAYAGVYNVALETDPGDLGEIVGTYPVERPMVSQGWGFLTMRITPVNGRTAIAGVLADGTRFTSGATVWGDVNGTVPLWVALYARKGSLTGQLSIGAGIPDNPVQAQLTWNKPAGVRNSPDAYGFTAVGLAAVPGSGLYDSTVVPPAFVLGLEINDFNWQGFAGALDFGPFIQDFDVSGNRVSPILPNDNQTRLALNSRAGSFTGSFKNPDALGVPRNAKFQGIALTEGGGLQLFGFFLMPNTARFPEYFIGGGVSGF
jgi:hypothetical protein